MTGGAEVAKHGCDIGVEVGSGFLCGAAEAGEERYENNWGEEESTHGVMEKIFGGRGVSVGTGTRDL